MISDRPVHLDLDTPSHSGFEAPAHGGLEARTGNDQSAHPDGGQDRHLQKDAAKLRELLDADKAAPPQASSKQVSQDESPDQRDVAALRPFDLFGGTTPTLVEPAPATESPEMTGLEENLARMARTLLVGESPGDETVRVELATENLPGVVLEVFKDQGAVVAQFICANEHSRTRLARAVPWLGESLSHSLNRDTLVRVLTDDPEDPSPVEVRHQAAPD